MQSALSAGAAGRKRRGRRAASLEVLARRGETTQRHIAALKLALLEVVEAEGEGERHHHQPRRISRARRPTKEAILAHNLVLLKARGGREGGGAGARESVDGRGGGALPRDNLPSAPAAAAPEAERNT